MSLLRDRHFWRILALFVAFSVFYYLDSLLDLLGLPNPHWGIFYTVYDFHRFLFAVPVLYSAYVFGVRGAVAATLLSALVFLPRALYISPYPDCMARSLAFCLAIGAFAVLVAGLRNTVSAQGLAEAALRESEQKYRSLFERSLDATVLADVNGTLLDANPAYLKMYGHGVEDIGRVNVTQFYDRRLEREDVIRQLREEGAVVGEIRQRKRDGTVMDCFRSSVAVNDDAGNLVAIQSVIRDITGSKRAQTELVESREELRRLAQRMEKAREEERTTLARELHDTAGQAVTALKLDVSHIKKRLEQGQAPTSEELDALNDLLDQTVDDVRRISSQLRPGALDDFGLDGAIEWQIDELRKRADLALTLSLPSEECRLDDARRTAVFRVFQELLTNVVRHAEACSVHVTLEGTGSVVTLTVADDGCGVASEKLEASGSLGIIGMRERLRPHGGELHYDSAPGKGTAARVVMPVE